MRTIYVVLVALAVMVSACTKGEQEEVIPASMLLEFVIPDYPAWEAASTRTTTDAAGAQHWATGDTLLVSVWWNERATYTPPRDADATFPLIYTGSRWVPDRECLWPYDVSSAYIRADYYGGLGKGGNYPDPLYDELIAWNGYPIVYSEFKHTNARCIFTGRPVDWALELYDEQQLYLSVSNPAIGGPDTFYIHPKEVRRIDFLLFPTDGEDKGPFNSFSYSPGYSWAYDLTALVASFEGQY
jgi:hypothetical protein